MSARDDSGFLLRWARRKADVRRGIATQADPPSVAAQPPAPARPAGDPVTAGVAPIPAAATAPREAAEAPPLPTLEDVARLTRESDYAPFVKPGVDAQVKNAALRKLFSDPHFNVMDGLDTYIDDYGKPDPIPESMLRRMNQAVSLGLFDAAPEEREAAGPATPQAQTRPVEAAADAGAVPIAEAEASPAGEAASVAFAADASGPGAFDASDVAAAAATPHDAEPAAAGRASIPRSPTA